MVDSSMRSVALISAVPFSKNLWQHDLAESSFYISPERLYLGKVCTCIVRSRCGKRIVLCEEVADMKRISRERSSAVLLLHIQAV